MKQRKLQLNKEIVAKLKKDESRNVHGGIYITGILTQGPGCRSVSRECVQVVNDPEWTNPMTSYCQSGLEHTCVQNDIYACGTDVWC